MNKKTVHIIGITGGSSSGKTFLCNKLIDIFGNKNILPIQLDSYYKDLKHLDFIEREKNNFDHPSSFEFKLLCKHLKQIKNNRNCEIPMYDYKTHTRKSDFNIINKQYSLILVEGILSLYNENVRNMMSLCVFIDTSNKLRKKRRINRDIKYRDRTQKSIEDQYKNTVEPMYKKYIEPMKNKSDIIIKKINRNDLGYKKLLREIENIINN